jgi:hypothetical protein
MELWKGIDIASELKALPTQLRSLFDDIAQRAAAHLAAPLEFYTQYAQHFFERKPQEVLPTLAYVLKRGNATVYEWRTGVTPSRVDRVEQEFVYDFGVESKQGADVMNLASEEINFDIGDISAAADTNQSEQV